MEEVLEIREDYFSSGLLKACTDVLSAFNPKTDVFEEQIRFKYKFKTETYYVLENGINLSKDLKVVETPLTLWKVESSSYEIKKHGSFNSETAYFLEKSIFHWSDNNGFNSTISDEEAQFLPHSIKELYFSFQERDEKYREYVEENYDEHGFNCLYAQGF